MKPIKPRKSFVLTPSRGGWVKKYRGKTYWVAPASVPAKQAEDIWHQKVVEINAGLTAKRVKSVMTVAALCTKYLDEKQGELRTGRIGLEHMGDIIETLTRFNRAAGGKTPLSGLSQTKFVEIAYKLTEGFANSTIRRRGAIIMAMFKMAADEGWIKQLPAFGRRWQTMMRPQIKKDPKPAAVADVWKMLEVLKNPAELGGERSVANCLRLTACIWLTMNGGYAPAELSALPLGCVQDGWIRVRRGKTGMRHDVPLWPETLAAIDAWLAVRPPGGELLFTSNTGKALILMNTKTDGQGRVVGVTRSSSFSLAFRHAAKRAGVAVSPYGVRKSHRSLSGGAGDESAADALFGHSLQGLRATYQAVSDARLMAVSMFVRDRFHARNE